MNVFVYLISVQIFVIKDFELGIKTHDTNETITHCDWDVVVKNRYTSRPRQLDRKRTKMPLYFGRFAEFHIAAKDARRESAAQEGERIHASEIWMEQDEKDGETAGGGGVTGGWFFCRWPRGGVRRNGGLERIRAENEPVSSALFKFLRATARWLSGYFSLPGRYFCKIEFFSENAHSIDHPPLRSPLSCRPRRSCALSRVCIPVSGIAILTK